MHDINNWNFVYRHLDKFFYFQTDEKIEEKWKIDNNTKLMNFFFLITETGLSSR